MPSPYRTEAFRELDVPLADALGEKAAKRLSGLGLRTVGDLLRHLPRRYFKGGELSDLSTLHAGEEAAVVARVTKLAVAGYGDKQRLEATVRDDGGSLRLTFFAGRKKHLLEYWQKALSRGERGIFLGKLTEFQRQLQMTHPTFVMLDATGNVVGHAEDTEYIGALSRSGLVGVYPAMAKLPTWVISACAQLCVERWQGIDDPLPPELREQAGVPEFGKAIKDIHLPDTLDDVWAAVKRLEFDEAFGAQLAMMQRRRVAEAQAAVPRKAKRKGLLADFDAALPFTLTAGQQQVGQEIAADLARTRPMQRLLQGEVGSGKTLVALRAMLTVVDAGGQAALMAPTEVLATQHALTLRRQLGAMAEGGTLAAPEHATRVTLLTGSMTAAQKKQALLEIASGEAGIVVGTHALLADRVQFADLGLVVVDEQHRFGVEQRNALAAKADARPHLLVMTATPIPRTVAMTMFGDLDVSNLREVPAGRSEVTTTVVDELEHPAWVVRAWERIREEVAAGRQAFVVASRIGEGTKPKEEDLAGAPDDGKTATPARGVVELHAMLSGGPLKGLRVGLLHGQLPAEEKDATMAAFAAGELDVLVATTVIEVGVDVPNASMMVISDADRFGISQLHQLRGRIGRGRHPGVCLQLTSTLPDSDARQRLDAVAATRDGFALADVDLEQRREGDVLGSSQAGGRSSLRLLRVVEHADLIAHARTVAQDVIRRDPDLKDPGLADYVTHLERVAADEWWEKA